MNYEYAEKSARLSIMAAEVQHFYGILRSTIKKKG
jgi:hypothetical protein